MQQVSVLLDLVFFQVDCQFLLFRAGGISESVFVYVSLRSELCFSI